MITKAIDQHELKTIVGNIDETQLVEILKLQPTLAELEEAVASASGDGDIVGREGHTMTDKVSAIVDILTAEDENELPRTP
jgi:hypothetical protein